MSFFLSKIFLINTALADGTSSSITISNPLGSISTIPGLINKIIDFLATLGIPVVTLLVIYGGWQILIAGGNETNFTKGKNTITYAALGYCIVLIAKGVSGLVEYMLTGSTTQATIDVGGIISRSANWLLGLMLALSVIMAIYAAFLFLTKSGDSKETERAKKILFYTAIALAIGLGAQTVSSLVQFFVNNSS